MVKRLTVMGLLLVSASITLGGQEAVSRALTPEVIAPTKLEGYLTTRSALLVTDVYPIGAVTVGRGDGRMEIAAVVGTEGGRERRRVRGLRIDLTETSRVPQPERSYLDLDELEGLSKALADMGDLAARWKDTDKPEYSEAQFATRSDFRIGLSQQRRQQRGFVSSGGIGGGRVPFDVAELARIKDLVDQGLLLLQGK